MKEWIRFSKSHIISSLLLIVIFFSFSCEKKTQEITKTTLQDANVNYISGYISAIIVSQGLSYSENKVLYVDGVDKRD